MHAGLLAGADADGLAVHGEADGVGLGVFEGDERDDEIDGSVVGKFLVCSHDVGQQRAVDLKVVAALLEGDAEDLLGLLGIGHVVRIHLHHVVGTLALGL